MTLMAASADSSEAARTGPHDISILVVGDLEGDEFRDVPAAFEVLAPNPRLFVASCPREAEAWLERGEAPACIVVAQAYPGQYSSEAVGRLWSRAPLSRLVALLGSWCEGEARSGQPWPGALRVYWHQWSARAPRCLAQLAAGRCGPWTLPPTATDEERWAADVGGAEGPKLVGLVAIHTPHAAMAEWLSDACRRIGCATVWAGPCRPAHIAGARAALFDATDLGHREAEQLARFASRVAPAPVIALIDFPRFEDWRRAERCGAAAVLSKPTSVEDLWWQLRRLRGT